MKLKKYNDLINEREGFDDIDEEYDINDETPLDDETIEEEDMEEDEETTDADVVETLLSTLRKMMKLSGFGRCYAFVDEDNAINIQFILNKTEKISNIMKVMNFLKKLESDILIQYESEFDLWESKEGDPLITGIFHYDENATADKWEDEEEEDEYEDENTPFDEGNATKEVDINDLPF